MDLWTVLVGVREDLPLYRKWWHRLAMAGAWFSSVFVYLVFATIVSRGHTVQVTRNTTLSLPLLSFTKGRTGVTTLEQLAGLSPVGVIKGDGRVEALQGSPGPQKIRCITPAEFKPGQSFTYAEPRTPTQKLTYFTIADTADQPPDQLRHCAATAGYASLTADRIVAYQMDSSISRRVIARAAWYGTLAIPVWLFLYWNVYYRGLVPIYARRRRRRTRSRFHTPTAF